MLLCCFTSMTQGLLGPQGLLWPLGVNDGRELTDLMDCVLDVLGFLFLLYKEEVLKSPVLLTLERVLGSSRFGVMGSEPKVIGETASGDPRGLETVE